MGNSIDEIVKKLDLLDEVLQDNCATHDWACYSIRIDEIKEKVNQLEQEIRNKAIDDFTKEIVAEYDNDGWPGVTDYLDYRLSIRELFAIAEQMKEV